MKEHGFISTVKSKGEYGLEREARRAVNSVFATLKSRLAPAASETIRSILPEEASLLWAAAPVSFKAGTPSGSPGSRHFIFRVQQVGRYDRSGDARRAVDSVMAALAKALPHEPGRFLGRMAPAEIMEAGAAGNGRAA